MFNPETFNPETIERHGDSVNASDYDLLLQRYREAIECIAGLVTSNTDALVVLSKAGYGNANLVH